LEGATYADKNENKNRNQLIDDGAASPVNGISDYRAENMVNTKDTHGTFQMGSPETENWRSVLEGLL